MHVSFFFPVLQYLWRKNLVLSIFQCVKFRDMNSRNPGLQIFIYKQYKSITLFAWSMGWYTTLQGDVEGDAAEVLWLQPFGCKVFASKAAVQAWLLWEPLSVTWLRMWLGCKAAQGLDFHDYVLKIKTGLIEHFSNITVTSVRGARIQLFWELAWGAVEPVSIPFLYKRMGCVAVTAGLPCSLCWLPALQTLPSLLSANTAVKTSKSATGHSDFPGKGAFFLVPPNFSF